MEFGGLDCWVYSKPHGKAPCGGDVYYASSCATGRIIRLLLADVAGHGYAVSRVADDLRALMRRFVNRLDQAEFVALLNDQFASSSPGDVFATAIVATFFAPSRRLCLCNAGHPRPLLYSASTRQIWKDHSQNFSPRFIEYRRTNFGNMPTPAPPLCSCATKTPFGRMRRRTPIG
jgi:sigma-B regulation protein RsbU (phosphoserine phosphatase)